MVLNQFNPSDSPTTVLTQQVQNSLLKRSNWVLLTLLLIVGTAVGTAFLTHWADELIEHRERGTSPKIDSGPWGDLLVRNIRVEQPMEYVGFDVTTAEGPLWNFGNLTSPALREILIQCGLTGDQADHLIASQVAGSETVIKPDHEFILGLDPAVREKLYLALSQNAANRAQANPYYIADGDVATLFDSNHPSDAKAISVMKKLLYTRNGFTYFSDPEVVLGYISSPQEREEFLQSLTSINSVMMGLLIRPDSYIEKPLNYWALSLPGVTMKDLRPLFEAQRREKDGGALSILYLLPPMAREHLFTSPLPPTGQEKMPDCHWTALNFFAETPDPNMADNEYASRFIQDNYYEIAVPGVPGDLVLLLDNQNKVIHSAVYIADDIVFTKNGINFAQPWVMMHEKDMVGHFSGLNPVRVAYFRKRGH